MIFIHGGILVKKLYSLFSEKEETFTAIMDNLFECLTDFFILIYLYVLAVAFSF